MLQFKKFPDIPVFIREEARGSRPNPEEPRFRLVARDEGSYPAYSGKIFLRSRGLSRARALNRKGERNSRVVPPFQESPRYLSPFQRNLFSPQCLDFHAEDQLTPWWHVGQPCGKASWESHRSLDPRDGKRDTSATLSLRSRSYVESTCRNWRKSRRFSAPVEMRPIFSAASRE